MNIQRTPRSASMVIFCVAVGAIGIVGCSSANVTGAPSAASSGSAAISTVQLSQELAHIHGAVVDPTNQTIIAGTHAGAWRIAVNGSVVKLGTSNDDFMGFTIVSPQRWIASGHPGSGSSSPNPLGLIESTDQGVTWVPVARVGETDFHALAARGNTVVGSDGHAGLIKSTDAGRSWAAAAPIQVAGVAYSGQRLLAATSKGIEFSTNDGGSFELVPQSPMAVMLSAVGNAAWAVDRTGQVWRSTDSGATWQVQASVPGAAGIAAVDDTRAYVITGTELVTVS